MSQPKRCHGCAFNKGAEANVDALTRAKAEIAVRLAHPFYCHEVGMVDGELGPDRVLCAGFVAEMSRRHDVHFYEALDRQAGYREAHQRALMGLIRFERALLEDNELALACAARGLDADAARVLTEVFDAVGAS